MPWAPKPSRGKRPNAAQKSLCISINDSMIAKMQALINQKCCLGKGTDRSMKKVIPAQANPSAIEEIKSEQNNQKPQNHHMVEG